MNSDRLSREFVVVDVTVGGEPPLDPISIALLEGDTRPLDDLSQFIAAEVIESSAQILVAMSSAAADGNEDFIVPDSTSYPVDYGVWILVEGIEQVVRRAGTLTVE